MTASQETKWRNLGFAEVLLHLKEIRTAKPILRLKLRHVQKFRECWLTNVRESALRKKQIFPKNDGLSLWLQQQTIEF